MFVERAVPELTEQSASLLTDSSRLTPGHDPREGLVRRHFLVKQDLEALEAPAQLSRLEQVIGRPRAGAERALRGRERLVQHDAAGHTRGAQRGKQIALQVTADD